MNGNRHILGWLAILAALAQPTVLGHTPTPTEPAPRAATSVGRVQFANSGSARVQADFQYAVAQLHNFQYPDAARVFRRIQQADPRFALAYWGEAMTYNHTVWMQQDASAARAVLARLGPDRAVRLAAAGTERERAYLDAVETLYGEGDKYERDRRYAAAMRRLHERWPDDVDATAFYALALLGTAHDGRDVATYMKSYALLEDLFPRYPQHPGVAHYLIHSVDDAAHAPLGVKAARAYGQIAPESAHAVHMTSHIYLALGQWDDVVAANERAIEVAARQERGNGAAPPGCGHSSTWLAYGYLQQGRYAAAKRMLAACLLEVQQRPVHADNEDQFDPDESSLATFYSMRLRYLLDGPASDQEVAGWSPEASKVPLAAFLREYTDALLALRADDGAAAGDVAARVERARSAASALNGAMDRFALSAQHPLRRVVAIELAQLDGLLQLRRGNRQGGMARLEAAALAEDGLAAAFGPPQVDQPTRELLGSLLLQAGSFGAARTQFERALELNPGRVSAQRGLLQASRAQGDAAEAASIAASLQRTLARADAGVDRGAAPRP
jgi:tetratricopeptide (TPR) repeat protein